MELFPNPASNQAFIRLELAQEEIVQMELWNSFGQLIRVYPSQRTIWLQERLALEGLASGVYILKVRAGGELFSRRLIIE